MTAGAPTKRRPTVMDRIGARVRQPTPGVVSPAMQRFFRWVVSPTFRLAFRPTIRGLDRVPTDAPCLVVANHSGGGIADIVCLATLWLEHRGPRGLTGMAHPAAFLIPGAGAFLRGVGAIPATYEAAEAAFAAGMSVLVFPGGDHEAFRPVWQAKRVDFAGRKGFLKLARRAGVPIVPLGITGSHYTNLIFWRSRLLPWIGVWPRLAGIKRLPVNLGLVAGLAGIGVAAHGLGPLAIAALVVAWAAFPLTYFLPLLPSKVRMSVGDAIPHAELFASAGRRGDLEPSYARVTGAIQELVLEPAPAAPPS